MKLEPQVCSSGLITVNWPRADVGGWHCFAVVETNDKTWLSRRSSITSTNAHRLVGVGKEKTGGSLDRKRTFRSMRVRRVGSRFVYRIQISIGPGVTNAFL